MRVGTLEKEPRTEIFRNAAFDDNDFQRVSITCENATENVFCYKKSPHPTKVHRRMLLHLTQQTPDEYCSLFFHFRPQD